MNNRRRISTLLFLLLGGITVLFSYFASGLYFDYNFENFFPEGDKDLDFFLEHRDKYGNDSDFALLIAVSENGIFDNNFLSEVDRISRSLDTMKFVEGVVSPTNLKFPVVGAFGVIQVPYIHLNEPARYKSDSARIYRDPLLIGTYFSDDSKSLCVFIDHTDELNNEEAGELLDNLNHLINSSSIDLRLLAKIRAQKKYLEKIMEQTFMFLLISIVLVCLFLWMTYRAAWGILVPLAVVIVAIVWILGLMGVFNHPLNIMTSLLPVIMFIVGMSDVVHMVSRYIEELRKGNPKIEALRMMIKEVGLATLLTSVTTAIGFFMLLFVNIPPLKYFGLFVGIGVFMAYVITILFLPSLLYRIKLPDVARSSDLQQKWKLFMSSLFLFTVKNRVKIAWTFLVILLFSIVGTLQVENNYYLLEDLADDEPIKADMHLLEQQYSGIRPIEISMTLQDKQQSFFDYEIISRIDSIDCYLRDSMGAGFVFSPAVLFRTMNKALNGGNSDSFTIPDALSDFKKTKKYLINHQQELPLNSVMNTEQNSARITGKTKDAGSNLAKKDRQKLKTYAESVGLLNYVDFQITGSSVILDKNNDTFVNDMVEGLSIAFLCIALLMWVLFQSFSATWISLVPNVIPLLFMAGMIGWTGFEINSTMSIVFTIAFGIAVDDTIHFLSKFKIELQKGRSKIYAVKRSMISTGKAIIVTTIILLSGFGSLAFSDFQSTFYIGFFVSIILMVAAITDLLLLPALLLMFYPETNRQKAEAS